MTDSRSGSLEEDEETGQDEERDSEEDPGAGAGQEVKGGGDHLLEADPGVMTIEEEMIDQEVEMTEEDPDQDPKTEKDLTQDPDPGTSGVRKIRVVTKPS